MNKNLLVLGIESSCDETAAALYSTEKGIISSQLFSQTELHKKYGGIVPEIASRAQLEKINFIVEEVLKLAKKNLNDIDTVAVSNEPGLTGSLLVGVSFAKAIAYATGKNIIGVNHLEAHAFSTMIENKIDFPHVCLTASGGHTQISYISALGKYKVIGNTHDDASGEAFDKVAKLLGYPYPGGPIIEKLAKEVDFEDFFGYPRNKTKNKNDLSMSFSGLKTAVIYDLAKKNAYDLNSKKFLQEENLELKQKVSSSLLVCIADIFENRILKALKIYPEIKAVSFSGGVACNKYIRERLKSTVEKKFSMPFFTPSIPLCTDNGSMIAFVGHYKAQQKNFDDLSLDVFKSRKIKIQSGKQQEKS